LFLVSWHADTQFFPFIDFTRSIFNIEILQLNPNIVYNLNPPESIIPIIISNP